MNTPRSIPCIHRTPRKRRAFTLLELLIAASIIALASIILVPGFARLIESTNYTNAVNTVTATLGRARSLSVRTGRYTGVAFLYDLTTQRYSMQVLELVSQGGSGYLTNVPSFQNAGAYCQAFRPAEGTTPVELPPGTAVYAMSYALTRTLKADRSALPASAYQIDNGVPGQGKPTLHWYCGEIIDEGVQPGPNAGELYPWIFPRNDPAYFVDPKTLTSTGGSIWPTDSNPMPAAAVMAVRHCNTFAVFFDPGGSVVSATSEGGRAIQNAYIEFPGQPVDKAVAIANQVELDYPSNFDPERAFTVGSHQRVAPNPEVILRAATSLAVVDLNKLSRETQIEKPWQVRPRTRLAIGGGSIQAPKRSDWPDIYYSDDSVRRISRWIDRNAELLTFNRFSGAVSRRPAP